MVNDRKCCASYLTYRKNDSVAIRFTKCIEVYVLRNYFLLIRVIHGTKVFKSLPPYILVGFLNYYTKY